MLRRRMGFFVIGWRASTGSASLERGAGCRVQNAEIWCAAPNQMGGEIL